MLSKRLACFAAFLLVAAVRVSAAQISPQPTSAGPSLPPVQSTSAPAATSSTGVQSAPGVTAEELLRSRMELGDGRDLWHPTRADLGFTLAPGIDPKAPANEARFEPNRARLLIYLNGIAPYVQRPPVNARVVVLARYMHSPLADWASSTAVPAKIIPAREGAALEVDKAADLIIESVTTDPLVVHLALPTRNWPPRTGIESLTGIDARLSHFVTRFNPGEAGRTKTVRKAISMINDRVVPPGAILSVNDIVGERTASRGFGIGHVFVDGQMKKDVGGGMCQVATTLFNAALLANLEIVERHQHVRTVPYVKAGSDATVWFGKKDFKLRNNTAYPIYISYITTKRNAICDIFGKANPGVKVEVNAYQQRNGPRDYSGSITRYTTQSGKRVKTYQALSRYKWTPALDYTR